MFSMSAVHPTDPKRPVIVGLAAGGSATHDGRRRSPLIRRAEFSRLPRRDAEVDRDVCRCTGYLRWLDFQHRG